MLDQTEIHKRCISENIKDRYSAAETLRTDFDRFPDKDQAWQDLHRLTQDKVNDVRWRAAYALKPAFSSVPAVGQAWQDLHRLTQDKDSYVRQGATEALGTAFSHIPDKDQAWQDLHRLTQDEDTDVRQRAVEALGTAFSHIPDKDQAWQDLHRLTQNKDIAMRWRAAKALGTAFSHIPYKDQARQDLHRLTQDKDSDVRWRAAEALGIACHVLDKDQAWQDLHRLTQDKNVYVRQRAAESLGTAFSHIPYKDQARQDLHRLTQDKDSDVRWRAAEALGIACHVLDKDQAWQDLYRLTQNGDNYVRRRAEQILGIAFRLHKMTQDKDSDVRWRAAEALGTAFIHIPYKDQAWQDLYSLTQDKDSYVRQRAAESLGTAFSHIPDKDQAWQDLHRLTQNKDSYVRMRAAEALGTAFSHIPDKDQAWQDLHRLTQDKDSAMRMRAAEALGTAFSHIPDKDQAWQDLHRLTQDDSNGVRVYAYQSLGKASVSKATEAHNNDTFKNELVIAVSFFEKSSQLSAYSPASFCHLFYRSFLAITFQEAKDGEAQEYLAEAKKVVNGSEARALLLEIVENIARALEVILKESQSSYEGASWREIQKDLKEVYEPYCSKASMLLDKSEDLAPGATKCVRRAFPIIGEQIESTISEIQAKSRALCRAAYGSKILRPIVTDFNRLAQGLSAKGEIQCRRKVQRMIPILQNFCELLPGNKCGRGCDLVSEIRIEEDLPETLGVILEALTYLQSNIELNAYQSETTKGLQDIQVKLGVANNKLDEVYTKLDEVNNMLKEVRYSVFKLKIDFGNGISNLAAMKMELEKLYRIAQMYPNASLRELYSCNEEQLQELSRDVDNRFVELNEILKKKASTDDIKKLERLKPAETWSSKFLDRADKGATLLTYISFLQDSIVILRPLLIG